MVHWRAKGDERFVMNKRTHAAKVTHRAPDGKFKKHPASGGRETASPTYLRDLGPAKGMNPDLKDAGHPNETDLPRSQK